MEMIPAWADTYIGLPYRFGARGPNEFDCWGIVRHVLLRQFGVDLPDHCEDTPESNADRQSMSGALLASAEQPEWRRIAGRERAAAPLIFAEEERPGDVVLIRRHLFPCHVGVIVCRGRMLHTENELNAMCVPIKSGREATAVYAIYRHKALDR